MCSIRSRQKCRVTGFLVCISVCFLLMVVSSFGQSLGDVAREQRQKQQSKGARAAKKVITDEDLPAHTTPDADSDHTSDKDKKDKSDKKDVQGTPAGAKNTSAAGEQWKARILAQKRVVADMQRQADRLAASIHFVDPNAYWNGPEYNQAQTRKQEKLHQFQEQIEEQKAKLEAMQEAARQAGFGNAVYDPE
jgi:hypothetical protein